MNRLPCLINIWDTISALSFSALGPRLKSIWNRKMILFSVLSRSSPPELNQLEPRQRKLTKSTTLSDGKSRMTVASGKVTVEASSSGYESSRGSDFSNEERFVYSGNSLYTKRLWYQLWAWQFYQCTNFVFIVLRPYSTVDWQLRICYHSLPVYKEFPGSVLETGHDQFDSFTSLVFCWRSQQPWSKPRPSQK